MGKILLCAVVLSLVSCNTDNPDYGSDGPGVGRHSDALTNSTIPPGTIIAFAGVKAPAGWLLCDGKAVLPSDYPDLHDAIGSSWGDGGDGDGPLFSLPDLRGRFLRGVDSGAQRDPDRDSRTEISQGGNKGDRVGTLQAGATALPHQPLATTNAGNHLGHLSITTINCGGLGSCAVGTLNNYAGEHGHPITGGDKETRPENVAVNWLIKY